jgi:ornithine carbamoyltransferase
MTKPELPGARDFRHGRRSVTVNHLINFNNYGADFLNKIIDRALMIKSNPLKFSTVLKGKRMYMLFQKTSTRTALSFGFGMMELGGYYFIQKWEDSNFAVGDIMDEVRYVGRNADIIMARLKLNQDIEKMVEFSSVPVINGCCNKHHPCQAMADILTVRELFGGFKVKMLYMGVRNNVLNSLMETLPRLGGELYSVTPLVNAPSVDKGIYDTAIKTGKYHDVDSGISKKELKILVREMDVVYTDSWVDMEFFNDKSFEKEKNERIAKMMPFQINNELLEGSKAVVMQDMPIHAGYEISREVVETHIDTILRQAENRRHAQNGILTVLLEDDYIRKYFE